MREVIRFTMIEARGHFTVTHDKWLRLLHENDQRLGDPKIDAAEATAAADAAAGL